MYNNGAKCFAPLLKVKEYKMKKFSLIFVLFAIVLAGCACKCENEPIVEANHKLIVPPNFGNMPK